MSIQETIEKFQNAVVQIATKSGTGTGFYLSDYDLVVTNNHVVKDRQKATIKGRTFDKMVARVVFTDEKYDVAFLIPPLDLKGLPELKLGNYETLKDGDSVIAIGHPYGLNYTATQGVISRVERIQQGLKYIQIDAAINPGNSGGPLVNENGAVVGVNTFIIKGGDNLGFALPVSYLKEALEQYKLIYGLIAIRCPSCSSLITQENIDAGMYCPNCGTKVNFPEKTDTDYTPVSGIAKIVEEILEKTGYDKELARSGLNRWEIECGKTRIKINYNPENYFIISDAFLCQLSSKNIRDLYAYLLNENYKMKNKLFSLHGDNIILSSLIYDLDITAESGESMFWNLFTLAEHHNKVLINEYGCRPIMEEH